MRRILQLLLPKLCCYWFFFPKQLTNLINYSFWMRIMTSFMLKTYFKGSFQLLVSILTIFLQHLPKIGIIPGPAKHKQTKTTRQQIHSHIKRVDVSRFPVVSNEAMQELNSVAVNKHSQNTLSSTKQLMSERLPKLAPVPPS